MNEVKNKSLAQQSPDREERLGNGLSAGLSNTAPGGRCLTDEEIALLVDGPNRVTTVTGAQRDRYLLHLSACDSCMEVFQLASELREEEAQIVSLITAPEPKAVRTRPRYNRSLALAASILVAAVGMIVFYRSGEIPKTPEELINRTWTADDTAGSAKTHAPADMEITKHSDEKSPPAAAPKVEKKKTQTQTQPEPGDRNRAKKEEAVRQKKLMMEKLEIVARHEKRERDEAESEVSAQLASSATPVVLKEAETPKIKKAAAVPEEKAIRGKRGGQKGGQKGVEEGVEKGALQDAAGDDSRAPVEKSKKQPERLMKKEGAPKIVRKGPRVTEQSINRQVALGSAVGLKRMEQLKSKFREHKTYIPAVRLSALFQESVGLAEVLNRSARKLGETAAQSGDYSKVNAFRMSVVPVYAIHMGGETLRVTPNVDYFRSMCDPDSPEYRFFSLARSGWSDRAGNWYGPQVQVGKKKERKFGGVETQSTRSAKKTADVLAASSVRSKKEALLSQWTDLYSRLTGSFKEIARHTIERLKKDNI